MRATIHRLVPGAMALAVSAVFADAPPAPVKDAPPADAKVVFSGNEWYSVIADRPAAVNHVSGVADRVSGVLARFGFRPEDLRPGKITVYVNSDDGVCAVDAGGGRTTVTIPLKRVPMGTDVAALEADYRIARALAAGALSRLAQAAGKTPAPTDWISEALAWESQIAAYPGMLEWLARIADEQGPGTLAQIAESNPDRLGSHERASLILLRAARAAMPEGADFRPVLAKGAMGRPIAECLGGVIPSSGADAEVWWPAAFYREIDRRPPAVAKPADSARRFGEFTRFVVSETPGGAKEARDIVLDAEGLIARRADPSLRAAVNRRIFEIKRDLLRANPVWFNALRDFGVFLEKLPVASPEELRALAAGVRAEAAHATTLTEEIDAALRDRLPERK